MVSNQDVVRFKTQLWLTFIILATITCNWAITASANLQSWESCKSESQVKKFRVYLKILAEVKEG